MYVFVRRLFANSVMMQPHGNLADHVVSNLLDVTTHDLANNLTNLKIEKRLIEFSHASIP